MPRHATTVPNRPGTIRESTRAATVPRVLFARAAADPDRLAVVDRRVRWTFAELDAQAARIAARLRQAGVGRGDCVGLLLDRSADFVAAALGVWKAGAAYLPLDPATPPARVALILADAASPLLLTHRGKGADLPAGSWTVVDLDRDPARAIDADDGPNALPGPDDLAYVIYTSGSTGRPKGVEISHANLNCLVAWHVGAFGLTPEDRASHVAGLAFDPAVWEVWPNLSAGASVHVADDLTRRVPSMLRDWLVAESINVAFIPTAMAGPLLAETWPDAAALRFLLVGGEALAHRPRPGLPFRLINCYGPAECTVVSTSAEIGPDPSAQAPPPPIGRPIPGSSAMVVDEAPRPVPDGQIGELVVIGDNVGLGYRNDPERTAASFVVLPTVDGPRRAYRTGDRVRVGPDGLLEFHGRFDEQVKVRGYRIEPGEVVAALAGCPGVAAAAVVARGAGADRALAAYVVAANGDRPDVDTLRARLSARLPDYMVPSHFVALDALPLTVNGKVDHSALPEPTPANALPAAESGPAVVDDGNGTEARVAALVAGLLKRPSIGRDDNIFLVGGHSMLGVQLVSRIRDEFGVQLSLRQLFTAPTVAAMSAEVARQTASVTGGLK